MADIPRYYWDSCMFFEYLNKEDVSPTKRRMVQQILSENKQRMNVIVTSVITDLEVIPEKLSQSDAYKEDAYRSQFDGVRMVSYEINSNVLKLAREIRNRYYRPRPEGGGYFKMMDLGDSIHLATAAILGVSEFHTRDDNGDKTKIPLLSLYKWAGEDRLCGRFDLKIVSPEADQGELLG